MTRLEKGTSPGFDPERHLLRVALINQTTMLAAESREIGEMIEAAIQRRDGEKGFEDSFRDFDTICNATQENQDAMVSMVEESDLDLMLVVGGYNSSNTKNLARIAHLRGVPTFHIEDVQSLEPDRIFYQPVETREIAEKGDWLPSEGLRRIGFTAGASTPDTKLAAVINRVCDLSGVNLAAVLSL